MSQGKNISPYKFLDAYGRGDVDNFFGRDQEVEDAYTKVFQSKILLVYGASGTGKSSLIHCGLANRFSQSDWMPIAIRRGGHILKSIRTQLNGYLYEDSLTSAADLPKPEEIKTQVQQVFLDHFKPLYFIFDQFEELFIFGDQAEWQAFADTLQVLLESELDLHFIFVVRGDYLEYLNEFEKQIPGFFDNRLRVEKMTAKQAEQSVIRPAENSSIQIEEGFVESLLQRLSNRANAIEPTFLQVYLDRLYREEYQRTEGKNMIFRTKDLDYIGPIDDILAEFVDEQVFKMPDSKLAWTILKCFVSLEGTKVPLRVDEVSDALQQLGEDVPRQKLIENLEELVSKRILKSADEEARMELRHDSLALKIYERISIQEKERLEVQRFLSLSFKEYQKRGTLLKDDDLAYILPHQRKLQLSPEMQSFLSTCQKHSRIAKRKAFNRRIVFSLIILLACSALIGWYYTGQEKERADRAAEAAKLATIKAQEEQEKAEASQSLAKFQEAEALKQAEIASRAQLQAELESKKARLAEQMARQEQSLAEAAELRALASAREALRQKSIAETAQAEEMRLGRLSLARQMALRAQQMEFPARAQLSMQAYQTHQANQGINGESAIYEALLNALKGADKNAFLIQQIDFKVQSWQVFKQQVFFESSPKEYYRWDSSSSKILSLQGPPPKLAISKPNLDIMGKYSVRWESGQLEWKGPNNDIRTFKVQVEGLVQVRVSPNGDYIAWGQDDGKVFLLEVSNGNILQLSSHFAGLSDLRFDPKNGRLASSGFDRMVQIWDLNQISKSPLRIKDLGYWVQGIQFEGADHIWVLSYEGHLYRFPLNSSDLFDQLCELKLPLPEQKEWQQWTEGKLELQNPCVP